MNTGPDPDKLAPPSEPGIGSDGGSPVQGHDGGADRSSSRRILVVEDEFLVALLLEGELEALGFSVVGPFTSVATGIEASRREHFDFAILDVNLGGEMVFPLADELSARGVPFLFVSGYGEVALPERHRAAPRLAKPYDQSALAREIEHLVAAHRQK
jgi:DNA-binding response OmpR family regulator